MEKLTEIIEKEPIRSTTEDEWLPLTARENRMIWLGVTAGLIALASLIFLIVI